MSHVCMEWIILETFHLDEAFKKIKNKALFLWIGMSPKWPLVIRKKVVCLRVVSQMNNWEDVCEKKLLEILIFQMYHHKANSIMSTHFHSQLDVKYCKTTVFII